MPTLMTDLDWINYMNYYPFYALINPMMTYISSAAYYRMRDCHSLQYLFSFKAMMAMSNGFFAHLSYSTTNQYVYICQDMTGFILVWKTIRVIGCRAKTWEALNDLWIWIWIRMDYL